MGGVSFDVYEKEIRDLKAEIYYYQTQAARLQAALEDAHRAMESGFWGNAKTMLETALANEQKP